jgi:hypothetical protein
MIEKAKKLVGVVHKKYIKKSSAGLCAGFGFCGTNFFKHLLNILSGLASFSKVEIC